MGHSQEALTSLGAIDWDQVPQDALSQFLTTTLTDAQTVVDSIPSPTPNVSGISGPTAAGGGPRPEAAAAAPAPADGAGKSPLLVQQTPEAEADAQQLRKEWKEAKVNPRDNPLGIKVFKLAAKDGKGTWFARQSIHHGLSFDDWKAGLQKEFGETMKTQGSPGSGNIRGIGAERRVESLTAEGGGSLEVFQLSAQFPGPTSPRDFITLLLTSDTSSSPPDQPRGPRQYMIVSKPCQHPDCPPRSGIIRATYESVEIIREIPANAPGSKMPLSSTDLPGPVPTSDDAKVDATASEQGEPPSTAVEWIMVTRSDPGGSVPRFMVDKGTPPGIVGDAGKFIKWVSAKSVGGFQTVTQEKPPTPSLAGISEPRGDTIAHVSEPSEDVVRSTGAQGDTEADAIGSRNGLYEIITGAVGAATSYVLSSGLRGNLESSVESIGGHGGMSMGSMPGGLYEDEDEASLSDTSSIGSFASALEKRLTAEIKENENVRVSENVRESHEGSRSDESKSQSTQERELKKLQERRRKLDENMAKMQERLDQKRQGEKEKDMASLAKAREKHEKEFAKQEAKYRKELKKIEEKREQEERKAEDRRRKAIEREEKANLSLELERTRAERDVALKEVQLLQAQVGELQAQNTTLAATLGRTAGVGGSDTSVPRTVAAGDHKDSSAVEL